MKNSIAKEIAREARWSYPLKSELKIRRGGVFKKGTKIIFGPEIRAVFALDSAVPSRPGQFRYEVVREGQRWGLFKYFRDARRYAGEIEHGAKVLKLRTHADRINEIAMGKF